MTLLRKHHFVYRLAIIVLDRYVVAVIVAAVVVGKNWRERINDSSDLFPDVLDIPRCGSSTPS